ncbi:efflux RND transporter periplasmic adaptor subunit [Xanthobacter pseudotagetidis]|uniref:efflux RND transporter periplasmic adaptor subunit n=1 Tax=Xanthobacter pseudotagetidis TaxID=3119911 RepID=UPI00372C1FBA
MSQHPTGPGPEDGTASQARPRGGSRGRRLVLAVALIAAVGGGAYGWSHGWFSPGTPAANAQAPQRQARVAVLAAQAVRKPMPIRLEALGTVEAIVTVPIRSRVAASIDAVRFADGASVKEGDVLFELDARVIDAQIRQAEATLARDKAQLDKVKRDVERYAGLAARNTVSQVQLEDARTAVDVQDATVEQDEANLQALKVQRGYYTIRAPVTGRMGVAAARPGTVIRVDDILATVRQTSPIYVAFGVPERYIGDLRAARDAKVAILLQGSGERVEGGRVAVIDNTVDPQTGTLISRALFPNADERLWPGTLGSVTVTLGEQDGVVAVPAEAIQNGQNGTFVFLLDGDVARVRPVSVARTVDGQAVVTKGLEGGETVVTDGQLSLREGSRVSVKNQPRPAAGS